MSTLHGWTHPTSFVRVADVKPGMILVADDGFPCIGCFSLRSVRLHPKLGLYIDCCGEDGCVGPHTLDGQVSEKTNPHYDPENPVYIGLWKYDPENPPPPARKCEYEQSVTVITDTGDTEQGAVATISTAEEAVVISEQLAANLPPTWSSPMPTVDFLQPTVRSVRYGDLFGEHPVKVIPVGNQVVDPTRIISAQLRPVDGQGAITPDFCDGATVVHPNITGEHVVYAFPGTEKKLITRSGKLVLVDGAEETPIALRDPRLTGTNDAVGIPVSGDAYEDISRGQGQPLAFYPDTEAAYENAPFSIRLAGRGEEKGVICTLSPDDDQGPVVSEQPAPDKVPEIAIGSVVVPVSPTRPFRSGSSLYSDAVVVSITPLVLVSGDGTMVWSETQSFESVRRVSRKATVGELAAVIMRIKRDVDTQKIISAASLLELAVVSSTVAISECRVSRPAFGGW